MTTVLVGPVWTPGPVSEADKVAAAEDAVDAAAAEAQRCWVRLLEALEENADVGMRRAAFDVGLAQLTFAFAVLHGTRADAISAGSAASSAA